MPSCQQTQLLYLQNVVNFTRNPMLTIIVYASASTHHRVTCNQQFATNENLIARRLKQYSVFYCVCNSLVSSNNYYQAAFIDLHDTELNHHSSFANIPTNQDNDNIGYLLLASANCKENGKTKIRTK